MIIKPAIFDTLNVSVVQTTRLGGESSKPYDAMNMGVFGSDSHACQNVDKCQQQNNMPHLPIFMQQVHGNEVVEYQKIPEKHGFIKADGCFTREKNIICAVLTADCLPILITDKKAQVAVALHCGWKGLYSNIIEQAIKKIAVNPRDLLCWLGPCISYQPYQVDATFRERFVQQRQSFADCFYQNKKGGWHADLKKIAVQQLHQHSIEHIVQSPYCTHDNRALFYSYRRDKETGRMASMIWLKG